MDAGGRGPALAAGCAAAFAVSLRGAEGPAGSSRRLRVLRGPSCRPHTSLLVGVTAAAAAATVTLIRVALSIAVAPVLARGPGGCRGGLDHTPSGRPAPRQQEAGAPGRPAVCEVPPRGRADTSFLNNAGDEGESVELLP